MYKRVNSIYDSFFKLLGDTNIPDGDIIDIGGDDGTVIAEINKNLKRNVHVAETNIERFGDNVTNITYIDTTDTIKGKFDHIDCALATFFMSIHHLPKMEEYLYEIISALKIGGIMCIKEHNLTSNNEDLVSILDMIHVPYIVNEAKNDDDIVKASNINYFNRGSMINFLELYGLRFIRVSKETQFQKIYYMILVKELGVQYDPTIIIKLIDSEFRLKKGTLLNKILTLNDKLYKTVIRRIKSVEISYYDKTIPGSEVLGVAKVNNITLMKAISEIIKN